MKSNTPHLFILHGWAVDQLNQQKWLPLITALEKQQIKCTFLPIPGLSAPLEEVWQLDDFVKWLDLQLAGEKEVVLLGHSFGGQVAIRYVSLHPGKVTKLILVDSAGIRDHSLKATLKRKVFWLMAKMGKVCFNFALARKILYKVARERDYLNSPPLLKRTMSLVLDAEITSDLHKIDCPTLLIWGREDTATPLKNAYLKAKLIPQNRLKIIDGARHSPQFTHVQQVAEFVAEFVRE